MKNFYLSISCVFMMLANMQAQHNAILTFTDTETSLPVANINVSMNNQTLITNASGQVSFAGLSDNTYVYDYSGNCYIGGFESVTVAGGDVNEDIFIAPTVTNEVFFFIGDPMAITGSTVVLTNNADFYQEIVTSSPWGGEIIGNVPFGDYSYTITTPCYETVSGEVSVDCNEGLGVMVAENPANATTNDVFFFIGDPMAITGSTVVLTNNGDFYQEFVTSSPWGGEIIGSVPFGDYSYTITTPCYESVSGEVTVDCNEGSGIMVAENPANATTNDVFFFIGEPLTISGAIVTVTDGADYNESFVTGAPFGDILFAVPYGEYTYTVEANCYETLTGFLTVNCNDGNGNLVAENPSEIVIDNTVIQDLNVLTAAAAGYNYQWVDCDNANSEIEGETNQTFTPAINGNYAVIISNENCSVISACNAVVSTGIFDTQKSISVLVYPNPASNDLKIQIESNSGNALIKIMTIDGQIVMNDSYSGSAVITLNVSDLASGIYILSVVNDKGQFVSPIIKQ